MRRTFLEIFLAVCLLATVSVSPDGTRGDQPRRSYRPAVAPARVPYYRRYSFAPRGRYGSPYYRIANSQIFGPAAAYVPYGAPVAGGYLYPPSYYALAYAGYPGLGYAGSWPGAALDWNPYSNPLLQATMLENQLRWGTALPAGYPEPRTRNHPRPSSPEQKAKSIRAQAQGDVWMKKLRFLNAYERYKVAQSAANDRPEPYFRLGLSLAAVGNFDSAVKYFKQGLDVDPQWPSHGDRLDALFGEDNRLSVLTMIERVGGWVREDIRDPDRLFLMGIVLYFDGDSRASEFFEYAYRLAGYGDHLLAFLRPSGPGRGSAMPPASIPPGAIWNGSNPGGPPAAAPYGAGPPNGGSAAPQPQEPEEAGSPQMVAPPDFGPPGNPQGMFSPPRAVPRGLYQRDSTPPNPLRNGNRPAPPSPVTPQATPTTPPSAPPDTKAGVRQLPPVPPLPAPEEPSAEGRAPGAPSLEGPSLGPPIGAAGGSTTAQSP